MASLRSTLRATLLLLFAAVGSAVALDGPSISDNATRSTYDFIVIGGGTAGNTVATRLSQYLPDTSILVIEAGPYAPNEDKINIPGLKGSTLGTHYDWNFTSIPQPHLLNRTITQSRGKVLGGTSALNLLIWDRASAPEYDAWEAVGNPGWNWDSMIEAMNKAENFSNPGPPIYTGTSGYGTAGPINAIVNKYMPAQQDAWIPTFAALGVEHNTVWLDGENVGAAYHSSSIDSAHYNRSYSAVEYLPRAGSNLEVVLNTQVAKINLEKVGESRAAIGVTLVNGDVINARKEVILSAGTIQSPQLLELSGIGSCEVLKEAGVEQKIELPGVGENLQDHPRIHLSYMLKDNYTSFDKLKIDPSYAAQQLKLWQAGELSAYDYAASAYSYQAWDSILGTDGTDDLIATAQQVVSALGNSTVDKAKLDFVTNTTLRSTIAQAEFAYSDGYTGSKGYPATDSPLYGKGFTTIIAGLMHELARGWVHINSSDPAAHPVYNPNFLSNEYDLQAQIAMAKYIRKIAQTSPFSEVWDAEYEPGLDIVQTDGEWETYVRNSTNTFYHPVGTCAMLPLKDGGVVNSELEVYGTSNLRVVDASVIPVLVSAHPQTGIYGIAERAAEIIAACWSSGDVS